MGTLICFVYIYSQLRCIYTTLWNSWLGSSTIGPQYVVGKGILLLRMYSSLLSGRNGIYGTHAMGKHHHRSYQVSACLQDLVPLGEARFRSPVVGPANGEILLDLGHGRLEIPVSPPVR